METVETAVLLEEQALRISRFCHQLVKRNVVAWYHALNIHTIFVGQALSALLLTYRLGQTTKMFLERLPPGRQTEGRKITARLYAAGMLVKVHDDEREELLRLQREFLGEPAIGILYLLLNDQCNFRCTYCFIENAIAPGYRFSLMDRLTARKALDLYCRVLSKRAGRKTVIFYGGEPLINRKILRFCLEYIRELKDRGLLPDDVAITINTNGSLVTKEIVDLFREHNVAVSVSLDGPKEVHDQCRRTTRNVGTFEQAIRGFQQLKDGRVNVGISCTVGEHNVDRLPQIVEWFISDLGIDFLGLNPLTDLPGRPLASEDYIKKFTEASIQCFLIARDKGLYEDRMMRKVEAFVGRRVYPFDCAGCGRQVVIAPDGQAGVCHAYTGTREYFSRANLDRLDPIGEAIWQEWCKRSPLGMPQCIDCPVLGICGGGCPYSARLNLGSIWSRDVYFCIYAQRVLEWLIWDVYKQVQKRGEGA